MIDCAERTDNASDPSKQAKMCTPYFNFFPSLFFHDTLTVPMQSPFKRSLIWL